jgi:hypothetical protein
VVFEKGAEESYVFAGRLHCLDALGEGGDGAGGGGKGRGYVVVHGIVHEAGEGSLVGADVVGVVVEDFADGVEAGV